MQGGPLAGISQFGPRYHIIRLLGMGGMGAVYQAWDDELGVSVALKVIRPEVTSTDDGARDIERRFKRELLLARQVTHKNVVRIHDLGEIEGIKYITMPYIQGSDLATILQKQGKLPVPRAIAIAQQLVGGLQAAHEVGVVHRDLKPANVMIDADDNRVVIMDFGIARSTSGAAATMAGAVVGTLEYMAPEQAMGQQVDHRADIYAFGLILRDMVLGLRRGTHAESAVAELMTRVQQPLKPVRTVDPSIPEPLAQIIERCTHPDPLARYQATSQLQHDLQLLTDAERVSTTAFAALTPLPGVSAPISLPTSPARSRRWVMLGAAALVLVGSAIAAALWFGRAPASESAATAKPTSLAVLPFRNVSGDSSVDWLGKLLADMLRTELGAAPGLRIVPSDRVSQILSDLRVSPTTELDAATLNRVSQVSNAELLVAGQYGRAGSSIQLRASLEGGNRGGAPVAVDAASENDLQRAIGQLAARLRDKVNIAPATNGAARSSLPGPTSSSIAALRAYSEGEQLARENRHQDALKQFALATKEDPTFALAFAKLAQTYDALGYSSEAQQMARAALDLSAQLPEEHRYLIDAMRTAASGDIEKAIAAYERLEKIAPNDSQLLFDLARVYEMRGNLDGARDRLTRVLELDPKYVAALNLIGQVEIRRRNFDEALKHLQPALFEAVKSGNEPAKGFALHAMGVAYKRLNKPVDALSNFEQALKIRRELKDRRAEAVTLGEIGQVLMALQRVDEAQSHYEESLKIRQTIGDKRGVGAMLLQLGGVHERREQYDAALDVLRRSLQIHVDLGDVAMQGLCLHNIASLYWLQGRFVDALTYYQQALQIRETSKVATDIAETLQGLADAQAHTGQFDQALTNYLRTIELRRAANDTLGAAKVSYSMAVVFAQRGRYAAALEAHERALKIVRETKDERWLITALNGYGTTLAMLGRHDAARQALDEAMTAASKPNNARVLVQTLIAQVESALYRGDYKEARTFATRASQIAAQSRHPHLTLLADLSVAKADVKDGRARATTARLRALVDSADRQQLQPVAAEAMLYAGEAELAAKNLTAARRHLEEALNLAEKLSLVPLTANAHYLLSVTLAQSGDAAGSSRHLANARQAIDTMRKEARTDDLLGRADLKRIVATS